MGTFFFCKSLCRDKDGCHTRARLEIHLWLIATLGSPELCSVGDPPSAIVSFLFFPIRSWFFPVSLKSRVMSFILTRRVCNELTHLQVNKKQKPFPWFVNRSSSLSLCKEKQTKTPKCVTPTAARRRQKGTFYFWFRTFETRVFYPLFLEAFGNFLRIFCCDGSTDEVQIGFFQWC